MTENEQLPPGGLGTRVWCPFVRPPPRPWAGPGDRDPLASLWAAGQGWVGVRPRPVNSCFGSSEGGHFGSELRHCRLRGKVVQNWASHSVFAPLHTAPSKGLLGHGNCSMAPWILPEGVPVLTSELRAQRETLAFMVSTVPVAPAAHLGPRRPVPLDVGLGAGGPESQFLPSHPGLRALQRHQAGRASGPT